jgi:cytochrome c oxidase subunit 4
METTHTHDEHHSGHDPAEMRKHVRIYMIVFASLMVLTLVTVGVSYLDLPTPAAIGLALIVASIKGTLVACYFMHLISERKLVLVIMALTVFFFVGVLLGPVLTEVDEIRP